MGFGLFYLFRAFTKHTEDSEIIMTLSEENMEYEMLE